MTESRPAHLRVVSDLPPSSGAIPRLPVRPTAADLPSGEDITVETVDLAGLVRSAEPLTVFTGLADQLAGLGYQCYVEIVHAAGQRDRLRRDISLAQAATWAPLADLLRSEQVAVCDGRVIGIGFVDRVAAGRASTSPAVPTGTGEQEAATQDAKGAARPDAPSRSHVLRDESGTVAAEAAELAGAYAGALLACRLGGTVGTTDAEVLHALVDHAVGIVAAERLQEQLESQRTRVLHLEQALSSNREIGVAIGILMATRRCSAEEAFALLRSVSQHNNRKIRDIAEQLAYTGELPPAPPRMTSAPSERQAARDAAAHGRCTGPAEQGQLRSPRDASPRAAATSMASRTAATTSAGTKSPGTRSAATKGAATTSAATTSGQTKKAETGTAGTGGAGNPTMVSVPPSPARLRGLRPPSAGPR